MPYGDDKKKLFEAAVRVAKDPPSPNERLAGILYDIGVRIQPNETRQPTPTKPIRPSKTR